jgi:predicted adenylyl cyclase CyaB
MRNLEIKAGTTSLPAARARLRRLDGAARHAALRQTDWYFAAPRGRVKLREIADGRTTSAELIVYQRPDTHGARTSRFVRLPVEEPAATRRLLAEIFGVTVCVRKRREVWLYENARIHLDDVRGLGTFLEIEVVVSAGLPQARRVMTALCEALAIRPRDVVGTSYSDLLLVGQGRRGAAGGRRRSTC